MQITRLCLLSVCIVSIQPCTIIDILRVENYANVIFTGRVLSTHQWSTDYPYSAFVWVFRVFYGESSLLEHYQMPYLQRPFYVIVDNITKCEDNSTLGYYDVKFFGIRIINARFHSSFPPLTITLENMKVIEGMIAY